MPMSNRKAKRLRREGKIANIKTGHGHVTYSGYGIHKDKRRRELEKMRWDE